MRPIQILLALHVAALAVLAIPGCGGGGDAYSGPVAVQKCTDPHLVKPGAESVQC